MMENTKTSKKGISTLIAAVLLIAVTLLISLIVSTSFTTLVKTQASTIQTRTGEAVNCTSSDINIESVFIDGTPRNQGRVLVRNSGQIQENIVSGQIVNKTGVAGALLTTVPLPIARGDIVSVLFNISYNNTVSTVNNITCANFERVIITTECTIVTYSRAPTNC